MKNNTHKLPSFLKLSVKFGLNRLQISRDISVLKKITHEQNFAFSIYSRPGVPRDLNPAIIPDIVS